MRSKESFNKAAELYNEVRPTYPKKAIDWIIDKTSLSLDSKLLEIAPGTGQATMRFGEKGYDIYAVELGDKLAELLVKNTSDMNVVVEVAPFEDWKPNHYQYDMVYCATAFHWLDSEVKYKKCSELLNKNGYLVLLWNHAVGTKNEIINEAYRLLFEYYPDRPFSTKPKTKEESNEQFEKGKQEINDSGNFLVTDYLEHKWDNIQSKEKTIKGFFTQSSYLSLDDISKKELNSKLDTLFEGLEDGINTKFLTTVYICKKK